MADTKTDRITANFRASKHRIDSYDDVLAQYTFALEDLERGDVDPKKVDAKIRLLRGATEALDKRREALEGAETLPTPHGTGNAALDLKRAASGPFSNVVGFTRPKP